MKYAFLLLILVAATTKPASIAHQVGLSIRDGRLVATQHKPERQDEEESYCTQYADLGKAWAWEGQWSYVNVIFHDDGPTSVEFSISRTETPHWLQLSLILRPDGSLQAQADSDGHVNAVVIFKDLAEMIDLGTHHALDNWVAADLVACLRRTGMELK